MTRLHRAVGIALLLLLTLACEVSVPIPTTQPLTVIDPVTTRETFALEGATRARVRLRMLSGELTVSPADVGQPTWAEFSYNVQEWEPSITQSVTARAGSLTINQGIGSQITLGGDYLNVWSIGLVQGLPLDLGLDLGAGIAEVELGGVSLSDFSLTVGSADATLSFAWPNPEPLGTLRVTAGAGDMTLTGLGNANMDRLTFTGGAGSVELDFGGEWTRSAVADIRAGVGRVTVRVPASLGVRVNFTGTPVSTVDTQGFEAQGENTYVNAAYGASPLTLTLNVTSGIGLIRLISQ